MNELLPHFGPRAAFARILRRFLEPLPLDRAWAHRLRQAHEQGSVVYVLRDLSFVDFFALDHLIQRLGLPPLGFGNDLGPWVFEPNWGSPWVHETEVARLRRALAEGRSAALFLKGPRPPGRLASSPRRGVAAGPFAGALPARSRTEGDAYLQTLLELQRTNERPILLVPQLFLWTRRSKEARYTVADALFGSREWPGTFRMAVQFLMNRSEVAVRAGEPLDLRSFLEYEANDEPPPSDAILARRLTYALLRRLERERRGVTGPVYKPADRLRNQVIRSPRLQKTIRDLAGDGSEQRRVLTKKAEDIVQQMEAHVDPTALRAMAALFERAVGRMYSSLDLDEDGLRRVADASRHATLVLLPSHKSHLDYMVLTHVFFKANLPVPVVAAGDNLAFFPLGAIFRRAGAFFIRRSFRGDRLYAAVVDAYVRRLVKDGWPLEFFLEGGRSRTGKLLAPKLGILSMVVDAALAFEPTTPSSKGRGLAPTVLFVPISIGYERLVEEHAYVRELTGGEKRKEDVRGLFAAAQTALGRYGRLNVQFGELLSLDAIRSELGDSAGPLTPAKRRALVTRLAYRVMNEINRVTAVTPSALVAASLLTDPRRGVSHHELVASCERIGRLLHGYSARFAPALVERHTPFSLRRAALDQACHRFVDAGHVEARWPGLPAGERRSRAAEGEAFYVVPDGARWSLDIAKNLVAPFFVTRALVATPLQASPDHSRRLDHLLDEVRFLSRLFKYEFQFRSDTTFETIFDETLEEMVREGQVLRHDSVVELAREPERREDAAVHARMIRNFLEGYRIAARGLKGLLKGSLSPKDLVKRTIATGEKMFLAKEIEMREAINGTLFENAFLSFVDLGYLSRSETKVLLPESYGSVETAATIEARIAGFR